MKISTADVTTTHAVSYMKQLCRHWAHRFPVEFDDEKGTIQMTQAICTLATSPAVLSVRVEMQDDADQPRLEQVVAEHLQRFGFKEELVFSWNRA